MAAAAAVADEGEKPHTVGFYRRPMEAEVEVHLHSIPEMAVVDVHTVVGIRILQVEFGGEEADTKVVLWGEVGIQVSVGKGSGCVVAAVVDYNGHAEAGVAEAHKRFVAVENTSSVGAAAPVVESKLRTVS